MQWQHLWEIIESAGFVPGLALGIVLAYIFVIAQSICRTRYLHDAAKLESPVKLGEQFYYIVPERLYNQFDHAGARARLLLEQLENGKKD
jgi:hypothetical protein